VIEFGALEFSQLPTELTFLYVLQRSNDGTRRQESMANHKRR
jgi:hypothetical protein